MIQIIICDDDSVFSNSLRRAIHKLYAASKTVCCIHTYSCAEEIPMRSMESCDILFLDIDFAGKQYSGMDIARKFRAVNKKAILIFVTHYAQYAPEGYEVQAFRYLLKSDIQRKLRQYLMEALNKLSAESETLHFTKFGEPFSVPIADVLYMESVGHSTDIHYATGAEASGSLKIYRSLKEIEDELSSRGFLRIHKSYLVNLRRIKVFHYTGVLLDDGTTLRVSQKYYGQQKKAYLLWKGEH